MESQNDLEKNGWLQGCFVNNFVTPSTQSKESKDFIVISQSCDIAHHNLEDEPYIEVMSYHFIDEINPMCTNSRNPRRLHLEVNEFDTTGISKTKYIEIHSKSKCLINKSEFIGKLPSENLRLDEKNKLILCNWLSARCARIALPTEFNRRVSSFKKFERLVKKTNNLISGLYIRISDEEELNEDEIYVVNILALTNESDNSKLEPVKKLLDGMKDHMDKCNIDASLIIRNEKEVSVADIKSFKPYNFDYLSFKEDGSDFPYKS